MVRRVKFLSSHSTYRELINLLDSTSLKTIPLVGARVSGSGDPLGWTITPQGATRSFHLRAASAAEQQSWLRGICDAQVASAQHGTRACVVQ